MIPQPTRPNTQLATTLTTIPARIVVGGVTPPAGVGLLDPMAVRMAATRRRMPDMMRVAVQAWRRCRLRRRRVGAVMVEVGGVWMVEYCRDVGRR